MNSVDGFIYGTGHDVGSAVQRNHLLKQLLLTRLIHTVALHFDLQASPHAASTCANNDSSYVGTARDTGSNHAARASHQETTVLAPGPNTGYPVDLDEDFV